MVLNFSVARIFLFHALLCFGLLAKASTPSGGLSPWSGGSSLKGGLWSASGNISGIAAVTRFSAGVYYDSPMLLQELSHKGLATVFPLKKIGVFSFTFNRFGYSLYNETNLSAGFARKFGNSVMAGVRFDVLNTSFGNEYGSATTLTGSAGVTVFVNDEFACSFSVFNPAKVKISKTSGERYPLVAESMMGWFPGKHFEVTAGFSLNSERGKHIRVEVLYTPSKIFSLKCGIASGSTPIFFGYSFHFRQMAIGMMSGYHDVMGFSPQISLAFNRK